jgi:predicted PurR-regulated permease PerM
MKVKIDIDTRTFVRFWLVVIGFALAALFIFKARTALIIICAAIFLAIALNPAVSRLSRWLPGGKRNQRRVLSTAIAYVVVVLLLAAFLFLAIPPIIDQTAKVVTAIPQWVRAASEQYGGVSDFVARYHLQAQLDSAIKAVQANSAQIGTGIGTHLVSGLGSFLAFVTEMILTLVLAFFILIEGPTWLNRIWSLYNNKETRNYHKSVLQRMYGVVTGYVTGQLTVSGLDGLSAGIAVFILSLIFHIPTSLALPTAVIAFLFSLIPLFGATIGAILVGLVLAFNNLTAAIIYLLFVIVYQQVESNYIVPKVQSKRLDLSGLMVLVAVTTGIYLFGVVGGIISIPIAGCIKVLAEEYIVYFKRRKVGADVVAKIENEKP